MPTIKIPLISLQTKFKLHIYWLWISFYSTNPRLKSISLHNIVLANYASPLAFKPNGDACINKRHHQPRGSFWLHQRRALKGRHSFPQLIFFSSNRADYSVAMGNTEVHNRELTHQAGHWGLEGLERSAWNLPRHQGGRSWSDLWRWCWWLSALWCCHGHLHSAYKGPTS